MCNQRFAARLFATLGIVMAACSGERPAGPTTPSSPVGPGSIRIHGVVRSETASTPVADAALAVFEITAASSPDIRLASITTAPNGTYSISFPARCDRMYGLKVAYPHPVIRCSRCPVWPLPTEACVSGDWLLDLWVQS